MSQQIIQVNFRFRGSREEYEKSVAKVAGICGNMPGLQWKIWLMNEEKKEAGGIYLFSDKAAADRFKKSVMFRYISTSPEYVNFNAKQFGLLDVPGMFTAAPTNMHLAGRYASVVN